MEIGRVHLPRPAFVRDLADALLERRDVRVVAIMDGSSSQARAALARWREVVKDNQLLIASSAELLRSLSMESCEAVILGAWAGGKLSEEAKKALTTIAPTPALVVTCEPYDPYGTLVKAELEESLLPLIQQWNAVLLVHDNTYETLRAYDAPLLRDRLFARPRRIRWYKRAVRVIFGVARLFARDSLRGWRSIPRY